MRIYNAPFKFRRHKLIDSSVLCSNCPVCLSNSHNRTLPWTVHQQLAYRLIFASCMPPHLSRCYEQKQTVQWLWSSFSPPGCCATAAWRAIRSAAVLLYIYFQRFPSDHLKIYWTELRRVSRVGRIVVVDDQCENSFSIPRGTFPRQPIFVGCIHTTEFQWHLADGVSVR